MFICKYLFTNYTDPVLYYVRHCISELSDVIIVLKPTFLCCSDSNGRALGRYPNWCADTTSHQDPAAQHRQKSRQHRLSQWRRTGRGVGGDLDSCVLCVVVKTVLLFLLVGTFYLLLLFLSGVQNRLSLQSVQNF